MSSLSSSSLLRGSFGRNIPASASRSIIINNNNNNNNSDGGGGGVRRGFSDLALLLDADFDYISHEQQAAVMQERKKNLQRADRKKANVNMSMSVNAMKGASVGVREEMNATLLPAAPAPLTTPTPPLQPTTRTQTQTKIKTKPKTKTTTESETQAETEIGTETDCPLGTNDYTSYSSSPLPAHKIHRRPTGGFDPREPGVSPSGVRHVQAYVPELRRHLSAEVTKEAAGLLRSVVHVRWECHNPDHHIDLYHGLLLGGRKIYFDDRLIVNERKLFDSGSQHEFTVRTTKVTVIIECKSTKFEYQLLINGEPLETHCS